MADTAVSVPHDSVTHDSVDDDMGRSPSIPVRLGRVLATAARAVPQRLVDLQAVTNGVAGDVLHRDDHALSIPMGFVHEGAPLNVGSEAMRCAHPGSARRVCVFVHGLMSSESWWGFPGDPGTTYGTLLAQDLGVTPLFVRYNTGRPISDNGRDLAALIERLSAMWPGAEVTLVGHSMGGLVSRSACRHGVASGQAWPERLARIVLLGSPLTGSLLAVAGDVATQTLAAVPHPVTRGIAAVASRRSAGIKDLRHGTVGEEWRDDTKPGRRRPAALPSRVRHYSVVGCVTHSDHPLVHVLGDVLVSGASASGRTVCGHRVVDVPEPHVVRMPNVSHLGLARSPRVYELLRHWFGMPTAPALPPASTHGRTSAPA